MFTVPTASSSPPSTPDTRSKTNNYFRPSTNFFAASNVSNTPAGSPDHPSTTPAGQPPASSVFGSAGYNSSIPYPQGRYGAIRSSPLRQPAHTRHVAYDDDAMDEDLMEESFLPNDEPIPSVEGLNMPAIAKTVANRTASLTESDDIILGTEHVMQNLHTFVRGNSASGLELDLALGTAVEESLRVWRPRYKTDGGRDRMGPGANASSFTKALYLTSLLLPLHHPSLRSQNQHSTFKTSRAFDQPKPIPQVLVEWLQAYHTPYPGEVEETLNFQPNACASDRFWDVVLSSVVRGSISEGLKLLKEADFREAETALQEGAAERGYRGKQLGNVQRVVNRAIAVLEACPAVQSNDWNVSNADWAIFRKRVDQAMQDLASFADGPGYGNGDDGVFGSENFGLASVRSDDFGLSRLPRRLPFPVQESLQALYNNLLGNGREITSSSADWLEATICQSLWWNGEEEEIGNVSFTASRNQQSLIRAKEDRPVDIMPRTAYREKLALSLRQVFAESEDAELQVNTSSSVEVGLACVLEDDLDGVLTILRGWSMPMSATVAEIAALGQWPGLSTPSQDIMEQFSQSDLMVLGLSQNQPKNSHDDVLISYAELLFTHADLESTTYQAQQEGWEVAIQLAGRVSIPSIANDRITSFLDKLDLSSASDAESEDTARIEKVMSLCERLALSPLARRTAERYASDLSDHTHNYGGSLYYFARAHNLTRVKEVLNLLISSCLVQSLAYPRKPDTTLQTLLTTPKAALAKLSLLDHEAAEILSIHFSGYAMLRNFYDLRDQEINAAANGTKAALRPIARKKAAAAALVAVITSAADSIHGGLYDASVDSIIPVDGLLVLLGEALVFLSPPSSPTTPTPTKSKTLLSAPQLLTLLSATESLATLPSASSIHTACADVLRAALAHAHERDGDAAASSILSKSTISHFSFDVVGRSGESGRGSEASLGGKSSGKGKGKQAGAGGGASGGDGAKRAWDWRMGFSAGAEPEELIRVLRLGLAKEVARAWVV